MGVMYSPLAQIYIGVMIMTMNDGLTSGTNAMMLSKIDRMVLNAVNLNI